MKILHLTFLWRKIAMENNIVNIEDKITQQTINTSIYTIEDVKEKLEKDKEDFPQWEHQYMRERLIEKAQQDQHMFDAIMQEHKSYKAGFDYVTKMAQKMLKERKGNQAIALDDKQVLTYLIEYFFTDDKEEYEKKLEQEKKKEENKKAALAKKEQKKKKANPPAETQKQETDPHVSQMVEVSNEEESDGQLSFSFI